MAGVYIHSVKVGDSVAYIHNKQCMICMMMLCFFLSTVISSSISYGEFFQKKSTEKSILHQRNVPSKLFFGGNRHVWKSCEEELRGR